MLSIERVWEDTEFFQIKVLAQSELICASVRSYATAPSINELASQLAFFPKSIFDRYLWENGTKGDDSTPFVSLEFWCKDRLGHIIIEIYMELDDGASYNKHNCCFFINTEPGLLNNFGKSLASLCKPGIGKKATLISLSNNLPVAELRK
jgi:hypothetical protein